MEVYSNPQTGPLPGPPGSYLSGVSAHNFNQILSLLFQYTSTVECRSCVVYAQDNNSLPVWIILSPAHHHISINSQPFQVRIVSWCIQSARWFLKHAPDDATQYKALTMTAVLSLFSPNSVPSAGCTFSEHGAVRYAFCISDVFTSRSFNAAKVRAILTVLLKPCFHMLNA